MVDVLSTRFRDVYAKWETRVDAVRHLEQGTPRFSLDGLRRAGRQVQERRFQSKEQARRVRESSLYRIKDSEPLLLQVSETSSFLRVCCSSCTPASRNSLVNSVSKRRNMGGTNVLLVNPRLDRLSKIFPIISHVCSFKKYDYPNVAKTVTNDERLAEAVKVTAEEMIGVEGGSKSCIIAKLEARVMTILSEMQINVSNTLLGIIAWVLYKVLPLCTKSVVVQADQIEILRKASDFGLPLILLPTHRSYMDYVIINLILLSNDIKCPIVVIEDRNLEIPFFKWLLRHLGALFTKSQIDATPEREGALYRTVLRMYLKESLKAGHNVEFFIEGDRTRNGRPCAPNDATLSVIVDSYIDGTIEDALLVPIAINYEHLVDGTFIREQFAEPTGRKKTFRSIVGDVWTTLMGSYGIARADFCQPFSLREMLESLRSRQNKCSAVGSIRKALTTTTSSLSLLDTDVDTVEDDRRLAGDIARHVVYDCAKSTPVMSTNVVSFLLLNKFRDGCTFNELTEAFRSIRQELGLANKNVAFCGDDVDIVNHALDILGSNLIERQDIGERVRGPDAGSETVSIRPILSLPNVLELSYYSNTMSLHYAMDSVIVNALYAILKFEIHDPKKIAEDDIVVFQDDLVKEAMRICSVLSYEFILCKSCQDLEHTVVETIRNLTFTGIISLKEEAYLEEELWSRRYAQNFDDSSDEEYALENLTKRIRYKLNVDSEHFERFKYLHTLLRPLIDAYAASAFTLRKLVGQSTGLSEGDLLREASTEIKVNLDRGTIDYGESSCVDPIRNSLRLFEDWNVLERRSLENVWTFHLTKEYDEDAAINSIYENIATLKWMRNVDGIS